MCDFCDGNRIIKSKNKQFQIYIYNNTNLSCDFESGFYGGCDDFDFKINFCPFCGRDLKKEEV